MNGTEYVAVDGRPAGTPSPLRRRQTPGKKSWIGSMKDTMGIVGDIVSPVIDENDIEALRD